MGKILNITIVVLILGALVYAYISFTGAEPEPEGFFTPGTEGVASVDSSGFDTEGATPDDEFVSLLIDLQRITLNTDFFTSALYASLKDFSRELTPATPGRVNPFAPIGVGGAPARTQRAAVGASVTSTTSPTVIDVPLPAEDPALFPEDDPDVFVPDPIFLDEGF